MEWIGMGYLKRQELTDVAKFVDIWHLDSAWCLPLNILAWALILYPAELKVNGYPFLSAILDFCELDTHLRLAFDMKFF